MASNQPIKSNQNYCLTKLFDQSQLFGDCRRQRDKFELVEEDKFVGHVFELNLPNNTACYQCTFSNDGRYMAGNHSDSKIYVTDLNTGKVINILDGRSRYSWSLAFHPVHSHILASGSLTGNVRVFDLKNDSSQEWQHTATAGQNIASLAFHPSLDLLCIATNCQLFFWNWRTGEDVVNVSTGKLNQRIRLVKFDAKGRLIAAVANDAQLTGDASPLRPSNVYSYMLSREYGAPNGGSFSAGEQANSVSILRNVFRLNPSTNEFRSAASMAESQQAVTSNLNNLRNIVSQIPAQPTPGEAAFRIGDNNPRTQNRTSEEALLNLASALSDSIRLDELLPDDLPSFEFLQNNYQTSTPSTRTVSERVRSYFQSIRRMENDPINQEPADDGQRGNPEDLNAMVFDSVNLVERFINRQRTMAEQQAESAANSSSQNGSSSATGGNSGGHFSSYFSSHFGFGTGLPASRNSRDYTLRRQLSRQISRPSQRADPQRSSSFEEASSSPSPREISSSISRTLTETLRESRLMQAGANSFNRVTNPFASQLGTNLLQSSSGSSPSSPGATANRNSNPDNHNRFYQLLQHQAFRQGARQELSSTSSEISAIVHQIQRSINLINLNSSYQADEEIQQLNSSGHAVLQRIIYYVNQREKLVHYRQIISGMLLENQRSNQNDPAQRSDLQRCYLFVHLLIKQADEIQRNLTNDLRFYELNRLYLMRRRAASGRPREAADNRSTGASHPSQADARQTESSFEESSSDTQSSSASSAASSSSARDDAVPSTSRGLSASKRKSDEDASKTKKFKIPLVRISTNEDGEESQQSEVDGQAMDSQTCTQSTERQARDYQLRAEMNRLISNLETLFERLNNSSRTNSAQSLSPAFISSLNIYPVSVQPYQRPVMISARLINSSSLNNSPPTHSAGQHFATFYIAPNPINEFTLSSLNNDLNQATYRLLCFGLKMNVRNLGIDLSKTDAYTLVVPKCKVHYDSSVDISRNGELLAALVPHESSSGLTLSIFSLKKSTLGDRLFVYVGSVNAVSLSFSPSSKYVALGLAPSRLYSSVVAEDQVEIAQIFALSDQVASMMREFSGRNRTGQQDKERLLDDEKDGDDLKRARSKANELVPMKSVNALRGDDCLNCIKWLPTADSRLIYCTNSGQSVVVRASSTEERWYHDVMSNRGRPPSDVLLSSISPRSSMRDQRL